MADRRRIRTLLYGDQPIEATELDLLHTPMMQRLYDLHQLGLTDRVFIDASHSRLQHTIGVLVQVDNILNAIVRNLDKASNRELKYRGPEGHTALVSAGDFASYIRSRHRAVRLMGLLHDLTHAPFGHTLEDEIDLQPVKHDEPARQADAFYRLLVQYLGWVREGSGDVDLGEEEHPDDFDDTLAAIMGSASTEPPPQDYSFIDALIDVGYRVVTAESLARRLERTPDGDAILTLLSDLRFAMRALLWLDALHSETILEPKADGLSLPGRILRDGEYAFEKVIDGILARAAARTSGADRIGKREQFWLPRDALFLDVIGNTICADLLDYAKRDSHHAGLKLDYDVERIVDNFTAVTHDRHPGSRGSSSLDPMIRTAISIYSHKLRADVPGELMNLLQVRFYVYQRVLYHPTKAIAGAMLGSALQLVGWEHLPPEFAYLGDAVFLDRVAEVSRCVFTLVNEAVGNWGDALSSVADGEDGLLARLDSAPQTSIIIAARRLVEDRRDHPIGDVLTDLNAARRIFARLAARRYNRAVFRLLPDFKLHPLYMDAGKIADVFRQPAVRAKVERAIEVKANLPRGTVTIHCPRSSGPRKIAEILILSRLHGEENVQPLRQLSEIDDKVFTKHEEAIRAVEQMYESMWSLSVSVSPPHNAKFKKLAPIIGRALYEQLDPDERDLTKTVPNDTRKEEELTGLAEPGMRRKRYVDVIYPDGRQVRRTLEEIALADEVIDLARTHPGPEEFSRLVTTLLERPETASPTGDTAERVTEQDGLRKTAALTNKEVRALAIHECRSYEEYLRSQAGGRRARGIIPIDVERIIRDVRQLALEEVSAIPDPNGELGQMEGLFDPGGNRILVARASNANAARRRFTLAHELGHAVMHKEAAARGLVYNRSEREADLFAAELLMPEEHVRSFFSDRYGSSGQVPLRPAIFRGTPEMPKGRFDSFEEFCAFVARAPGPGGAASFAESFGVSRTAAEMRLRELGLLKL